jgi:hypothetical protein
MYGEMAMAEIPVGWTENKNRDPQRGAVCLTHAAQILSNSHICNYLLNIFDYFDAKCMERVGIMRGAFSAN